MSDKFENILRLCNVQCNCPCVCSHLRFLLDFEELCHIREIFLVGFSHLFLCSLWVHDLQPLQTRAQWLLPKIKPMWCPGAVRKRGCLLIFTCKGVNATLELVPEERSLTVDFPPYVMLCFCNVLCCVTKTEKCTDIRNEELYLWVTGDVKMTHEFTWRDLEILALVASLTWACLTRPLPLFPSWPRLKPRSSWYASSSICNTTAKISWKSHCFCFSSQESSKVKHKTKQTQLYLSVSLS